MQKTARNPTWQGWPSKGSLSPHLHASWGHLTRSSQPPGQAGLLSLHLFHGGGAEVYGDQESHPKWDLSARV